MFGSRGVSTRQSEEDGVDQVAGQSTGLMKGSVDLTALASGD